jgi:hypothetical protein
MTNWNVRNKRFNYFRTQKQQSDDEEVTFAPSALGEVVRDSLRKAQHDGHVDGIKREIKAALDDTTNTENPAGAPYASPVNQGGLSYEQSHPAGTPVLPEDADFDSIRETTAADNNQRRLRKMHAAFDGSNALDKKAYSYPHHLGSGNQALVPKQIRKLATQLGISSQSGQGIIPTKTKTKANPANVDSVVREHVLKHLDELKS